MAAQNGHERCMQALLEAGADIEAVDCQGLTALHHSAVEGQLGCVRMMLAAGACVDDPARGLSSLTALQLAVAAGHESCVQALLLEAGADVGAVDSKGMTAVHYAAIRGHLGCLQSLLAAGGRVNDPASGHGYMAALQMAAQKGHESCVQALLAAGADTEAANRPGRTALQTVALDSGLGCGQAAGVTSDLHSWYDYKTALHLAALNGHAGCVRVLLAAGANVEAVDQLHATALHWAALGGHVTCVKLLIDAHANINAMDCLGRTALHWAAKNGHLSAIQCLVEAGADLLRSGRAALTPSETAAVEMQHAAAQLLTGLERRQEARRRLGQCC
jgi:ankyrin repeat protein